MRSLRNTVVRPRRLIVALGAMGTLLAVGIGQSVGGNETRQLTKVRFQLVWTASANSTPFIVAEQKGFYRQAGLDLKIYENQDPTAAIPLVGSGTREMGASYPPDVLLAVEKGIPLVAVWAQYQQNPLGIVSTLQGANIRRPRDMIGKRIGVTALPMDRAQFDLMLRNNGIPKDRVEVVDPGFNGGTLVGEGKLDGASAVPWFEVVGLKLAGKTPVLMQYRHNGGQLDFPFIVAIANKKWADKNPQAVRAFVRATIRGYNWARANRKAAVDIIMKRFPRLDRRMQAIMWNEVIPLSESSLTRRRNVGYFNVPQLVSLSKFLSRNGLLKKSVDARLVFTNKYQPN